jgi:DNA-binding NtrC family response regulator
MSPHILMVDDEAAIRELYTLYFNTQGIDVTTASSAIDALDIVYRAKFDLIILDLGLGDSNGMDLIEPVKLAQPNAPIFIYTGRTIDQALREEAYKRGAVRFLSKSYPLNYVVDEIRRALGERKQT